MWTSDRLGQLVEKGFLNFGEFSGVHNLEDIFDFVEVHDLLGAVRLRPVTQQSKNDLRRREVSIVRSNKKLRLFNSDGAGAYVFGQARILLQELNNTVRQLGVVHAQALDLVHG